MLNNICTFIKANPSAKKFLNNFDKFENFAEKTEVILKLSVEEKITDII